MARGGVGRRKVRPNLGADREGTWLLNLTVLRRLDPAVAHPDRSFLTASVPTFRLGFHVRRLVDAGHRVRVVRQTETAAIKAASSHGGAAMFARELSAVYTRATIEAAAGEMEGGGDAPEEEGSRYLVCVVDREVETLGREGFEVKVGVVAVEVSTGEVAHGEFMDGVSRTGLEAVLLGLAPVEVILGTPLSFATEKMAFEMYGMLARNVSALTGEYVKPAYGGEKEAFLKKVVTPIYSTIAKYLDENTQLIDPSHPGQPIQWMRTRRKIKAE